MLVSSGKENARCSGGDGSEEMTNGLGIPFGTRAPGLSLYAPCGVESDTNSGFLHECWFALCSTSFGICG